MLVAILIFWPGMVTAWLDKEVEVDLDKVKIEVQTDYDSRSDQERAADEEEDLGKMFERRGKE
jgi:hypothetical protein